MSEPWLLAWPLGAGLALGALFFGGLRWTVIRAVASQRPALWFLASLLLRMGVTLTGFYFVAGVSWVRWLACLLGFVLARLIVTRLTRPRAQRRSALLPENGRAS